MRHGESFNNILSMFPKNDASDYNEKRSVDPELSSTGQDACRRMGAKFTELGFKLDRIMCSGLKRAILSAKLFREGYLGPEADLLPIKVKLNTHEKGGCHHGGKCYPGLTRE